MVTAEKMREVSESAKENLTKIFIKTLFLEIETAAKIGANLILKDVGNTRIDEVKQALIEEGFEVEVTDLHYFTKIKVSW